MNRRLTIGVFVALGLALAVGLAFLVAPEASSSPDGLEKVAQDKGFAEGATDHDLGGSPTADYGVKGLGEGRLSTGVAGTIGIAVTFAVAGGLALAVRRFGGGGDASGPVDPVGGDPRAAPAGGAVGADAPRAAG